MKKVEVGGFIDSYKQGDLRVNEMYTPYFLGFFSVFDENATYEEIIRTFVQMHRLPSLNDPRLRYNCILQVWQRGKTQRPISQPVVLREGQTLASTHLTQLVIDDSTYTRFSSTPIFCAISLEIRDLPLPKEKPVGTPASWDQIVNAFLTSLAANAINFTASIVTITTALILIEKQWSRKHSMSSQVISSQPPDSDIVAIRLLMMDGTHHRFEEWLTEPARLKHYIDVFNQSASAVKPLQAVFVLKKDGPVIVDVSEGTQNNLPLNEALSYLHIDPAQQ